MGTLHNKDERRGVQAMVAMHFQCHGACKKNGFELARGAVTYEEADKKPDSSIAVWKARLTLCFSPFVVLVPILFASLLSPFLQHYRSLHLSG